MRLAALIVLSLAAGGLPDALAQTAPPTFVLETAKSRYLVGEPVVVTIAQRGAAAIYDEGWERFGSDDAHFRILVDRGSGFTRFRRRVLYAAGERIAVRTLVPDQRRQEFVLSFDDAIGGVLFPHAGRARMVVEYQDDVLGVVRSNVVVVEVVEPSGVERTAFDAIRTLPERGLQFYLDLTVADDAPSLSDAEAQRVLADFPRSVYVQGARVRNLALQVSYPSTRYDPADLASPAPIDRRERRRLAQQRRAALVTEAEALVSDLAGGQFEPDALAVLAATYQANDQDELGRRTWQRVIERFPRREAADEARQALAADEPEG